MFDLGQGCGQPNVWIRYNPDSFITSGGERGDVKPAQRQGALVQMVKKLAEGNWTDWLGVGYSHVCYMFYDGCGSRKEDHVWETLDGWDELHRE